MFDVAKPGSSKSKGFIPVGWYPTAVKVIGNQIYVANAKGFTSKPNPNGPDPVHPDGQAYHQGDTSKKLESQYIGGLFKGTLSIIDIPSDKQLSDFSRAVYGNTPYNKNKELISVGEAGNPIPQKVGDYMWTMRVTPVSPSKTLIELAWLVDKNAIEGEHYNLDRLTEFWKITGEQDWALCENNFAGIESSHYLPGPYAPVEIDVVKFVDWYLSRLKDGILELSA